MDVDPSNSDMRHDAAGLCWLVGICAALTVAMTAAGATLMLAPLPAATPDSAQLQQDRDGGPEGCIAEECCGH
jgi:hypothetical protein